MKEMKDVTFKPNINKKSQYMISKKQKYNHNRVFQPAEDRLLKEG